MLSSIQPSASHASPPQPLGLTARRLPNEAIFPPNPNKLQPLIPSRDEAATIQPEARSLRRFSLRPLPLGATHSCAAFPTTPWNNLPNEPIFPSNSNKLKPLAPFRVEATYPGPSLPGNIKGGTHAPPRSLGSPRKPAKFGPFSNPSERRLESRPQRGPQPRMAALLPGDFRHARHARKITALEERRRGAAGSQPRTLLAIVALTGEDGPFLCPQDASPSQRHTQLLTVGFSLHQSPSAGGPAEP